MPSEDVLDKVEVGPSGLPFTYGLDGKPVTLRVAAELYEDFERRVLYTTPVTLPDGRPAIVRTLCLVFDDEAATEMVPEDHVPQVFASAAYHPTGWCLHRLWTYGSPEEAKAAHPEAVEEFTSGRARVAAA
ncbi:hypothetical protein [Streptomyces sp. NPDC057002]|uniref:hypothetical protein n=1 Tax=Streptomyces sp. NPDC057002 TaxID=3345992 RepID=UPI0036393CB3